jgi:hypothetical protein
MTYPTGPSRMATQRGMGGPRSSSASRRRQSLAEARPPANQSHPVPRGQREGPIVRATEQPTRCAWQEKRVGLYSLPEYEHWLQ